MEISKKTISRIYIQKIKRGKHKLPGAGARDKLQSGVERFRLKQAKKKSFHERGALAQRQKSGKVGRETSSPRPKKAFHSGGVVRGDRINVYCRTGKIGSPWEGVNGKKKKSKKQSQKRGNLPRDRRRNGRENWKKGPKEKDMGVGTTSSLQQYRALIPL